MLSRQTGLCAVFASVVLLFATSARAELLVPGAVTEKRVALVIGNSSYTYASSLEKPRPDAHAIAEMFRTAHFDSVEEYLDLDGRGLERVVREFGDKTRDANVAVVYFSGHGVQLNGSDYLVPVDAQVVTERDVRDRTLPLERILAAVEPATVDGRYTALLAGRVVALEEVDLPDRHLARIQVDLKLFDDAGALVWSRLVTVEEGERAETAADVMRQMQRAVARLVDEVRRELAAVLKRAD